MADGSFAELQQQEGNTSLEKIFSQLTGNSKGESVADDLLRAFNE